MKRSLFVNVLKYASAVFEDAAKAGANPTKTRHIIMAAAADAGSHSLLTWATGGDCPVRPLQFATLDVGSLGTRQEQLMDAIRVGLSEDVSQEEAAQAWRSYAFSLGAIYIPGLIFAAGALTCCLPLWIGRCRAHRSCAPGPDGPSRRTQFLANTGFPFFGLMTLASCVLGLLAFDDLGASVGHTACRFATVLQEATAAADTANSSLTRIVLRTYAAGDMATAFDSSLDALQASATDSCAAVSAAAATADQLAADVESAGQPADAVRAVAASLRGACGESLAVARLDQAHAAADGMREVVLQAREVFLALVDVVRGVQDELRHADKTAGEYANHIFPLDPQIPNGWPDVYRRGFSLGLLIFLPPLVLIPVALCAAPGMAVTRKKREYCCAGFGVQWVGASWVICGLACVAYVLIGSAVLSGAAASQDAVVVAGGLPGNFLHLFEGTRACAGIPPVATPADLPFHPAMIAALAADITDLSAPPAGPLGALSSPPVAPPAAVSAEQRSGRRLLADGRLRADGRPRVEASAVLEAEPRRLQDRVFGCDLVSVALTACWAGAPAVDAILDRLGLSWTLGTLRVQLDALEAALGGAQLTAGIDGSAFEAAVDRALATVGDATPADFGLNCPAEGQRYVEWCTAAIFSDGTPAGCTPLCDCAEAEAACTSVRESIPNLQAQVAAVQMQVGVLVRAIPAVDVRSAAAGAELVGLLRSAADIVEALAQCSWLADGTDNLITAASGVASAAYILAAFALFLAATALGAYMPAAIAVQIVHGDVG
jgi:hypothetical protein